MDVCYKPSDQEELVNEAFSRQIGCLQVLVLMGDLNHSNICLRDNTSGHKQSMRFLKYVVITSFM